MKQYRKEWLISIFLIFLFFLNLIPILWLGTYNYPCADDFGFSANSHIVWQETHSILQVLKGALDTTIDRWFTWQGTFSTIFIMALQPAIWGESFYSLTPWIMIGAMTFSAAYFLYVLLVRIMHTRIPIFLSITAVYLLFALQCMIDKTQGFFWFNGATHYMLPHCVSLVLIGCLLRLLTEKKHLIRRTILCCLLALFVGGSNYITSLIAAVLFAVALLMFIYNKRKQECRLLLPPFLVFLIAFVINVAAPGNMVRSETMAVQYGVVKSILLSFYYSVEYITETWLDWTWLVFILLILPFLWELVKVIGNRFSYRFPLLVTGFSYCLLSAMFTPSLFAEGIPGGGRIFNIIFLDTILLIMGNLFYYMGWLYTHHVIPAVPAEEQSAMDNNSCLETKNGFLYLTGVVCIAFFIGALYTIVNPDQFTSTSAAVSILSGEAAAYGEEGENRTRLIRESDGISVTLPRFQAQPSLLYYSDIEENPDDWKNNLMERYYQLESVTGIVESNH